MRYVRIAVTVAGSDSIGGAGIQADLKTFSSFGVYGTTAVTAITAQNTFEVSDALILPGKVVYSQLKAIAEDCGMDAGKTGMLGNADVVEHAVKFFSEYEFPLVVDPVMIAKSGARLLSDDGIKAMKEKLIPRAFCITPNTEEAEMLSGIEISDVDDMISAGEKIVNEYGCTSALIKGGHLKGDRVADILYYDGKVYVFESDRIEGCFHGTGCMLSAGITANLALGRDIVESVELARKAVYDGMSYSISAGKKCHSVNSTAFMEMKAIAFEMTGELKNALKLLEGIDGVESLVPEVGMNFVYAMPVIYAKSPDDVLAVEGRIFKGRNRIVHSGSLDFGVSRHLARAVLKYMEFYPEFRAAINLRHSDDIIEKAEKAGFSVSFYDRREEPEEVKWKEGATIPWGIEEAIKRAGKRPDVVYHLGDLGKEPMVVVFGTSPMDVVDKIKGILDL